MSQANATNTTLMSSSMTVAEYLAMEKNAIDKHDYVDGKVIDVRQMSGGTADHSRITINWLISLSQRLKGKPCQLFDSNLKVRSPRRRTYRYPDISVACNPQFDPDEGDELTLLNPTLIIEIISPSTERQDRHAKLIEYFAIESFREYVLTSQDTPFVETFYRDDNGQWLFNFASGTDAVARLRSLDLQIPLSEIFAGITFELTEPQPDEKADGEAKPGM